jgi:integrase
MKAYKTNSGKWRCQARYIDSRGKVVRPSFTADTKKEAEYLAMQYVMEKKDMLSHKTIELAVSKFIENRSAVLSPSTIRGYRQIERNQLDPIKNYDVSEITSEVLQKFVNDLAIKYSPKTVRNVYGLVISSIKAENPNASINVRLPQKKVETRHIPTDEDIKKLLEEAKSDEYVRKAILLAAVGTLRRGEVCALCYEDIHNTTVHVHSDMVCDENNQWIIKNVPKTSSSDRYIEFSEEIIKELGTGKGRIIPITPNALGARYRVLCAKLDMDFRFHDLRHYAASIMHAIGIPDQYIMERGGWKSDTILKSVYRNVLNDKQNEFSSKTNEYLNKLI